MHIFSIKRKILLWFEYFYELFIPIIYWKDFDALWNRDGGVVSSLIYILESTAATYQDRGEKKLLYFFYDTDVCGEKSG